MKLSRCEGEVEFLLRPRSVCSSHLICLIFSEDNYPLKGQASRSWRSWECCKFHTKGHNITSFPSFLNYLERGMTRRKPHFLGTFLIFWNHHQLTFSSSSIEFEKWVSGLRTDEGVFWMKTLVNHQFFDKKVKRMLWWSFEFISEMVAQFLIDSN